MQYCSEYVISHIDCEVILILKIKKKRKRNAKTIVHCTGISQITRYIQLYFWTKNRLNSETYKEYEIFGMVARKRSKNHSHN